LEEKVLAQEIERKFLIKNEEWRKLTEGVLYRQGYLSTVPERTVRVRVIGQKAYFTVKGLTKGVSRLEFEYEIPLLDANQMLDQLCERPIIEKFRHKIDFQGLTWEIDEYLGENQGLIIAEVELDSESEVLELPEWVGKEVSDDPKYYNANLVANPFSKWLKP
jgi:CYTH domain-containing protein